MLKKLAVFLSVLFLLIGCSSIEKEKEKEYQSDRKFLYDRPIR